MAAFTQAQAPSAIVTEIPGRFAPPSIVDRRNMATVTADTATSSRNAFLPRAESLTLDFQTPTQVVEELGTNYNVGEYDQLPESKVSLTNYDVGTGVISLITGKAVLVTGTTTFTPNDLGTAKVDLVTAYADPNGKLFYSEYNGDLVIDEYSSTLKNKSAAMEAYSLTGFNQLGFRGFFITKCYIVQAADVTASGFSIATLLGANEAPVPVPIPTAGQPPNYWVQNGAINFVKIERWRSTTGWFRFKETSGTVATGVCKYVAGTGFTFAAGDLIAGDVFYLTYATYGSSVANGQIIPTLSLDTSDPIAVDTRLCAITIAAGAVARGQSFDMKVALKRTRAEGIGDLDGLYGPPQMPEVTLNLDVNFTGAGPDTLLRTGSLYGTDGGGTVTGDFVDANYETRLMLNTPTAVAVTVGDPRNAGAILKTVTSSNAVFKQRTLTNQSKNAVTMKYTGSDQIGNVSVSVTH